ncbi:MAG: EF-P lysine aminoacylase EpmA [Acidobacteriota bacterium]|nr:EF-P lysine aminoacylase EpmA [Acidobacteriota bacterium]
MSTSRGPRTDWRPNASLEAAKARAQLLASVRDFFRERQVLEVETPLLGAAPVTDVHLDSFATTYSGPGETDGLPYYLSTSPELAMKRLLAADFGPIFQICKAFRNGESGRSHNPEFTILEWYRPGWDHHTLMDEVGELVSAVLASPKPDRVTYAEAFVATGIDAHDPDEDVLAAALAQWRLPAAETTAEATQALFARVVEPTLGSKRPTFVYDFPVDQAAMARLRTGERPIAERFELYFRGQELANGFCELCDADEQRRRFEADVEERERRGLPAVQPDQRFLAALTAGLPACSGVALGIDRLLMLALGSDDIGQTLTFPFSRA